MEVQRHLSPTLLILEDHQEVVGWLLVLTYVWTPLTHYYVESNEWVAYMETHPKYLFSVDFIALQIVARTNWVKQCSYIK